MATTPDPTAPTAPAAPPEPIPVLERIRTEGKSWQELAAKYGVDNPNPPWKVSLDGTCEALNMDACALPSLERRNEEDDLSATLYQDVPYPERQLVSLAHTMIKRGLVDEKQLAERIEEVRRRLAE